MNNLLSKFLVDFAAAQLAAKNACTGEDGGTCNVDSVLVKLQFSDEEIKEFRMETGIYIGECLTGIYQGYRFLGIKFCGQANERTRMAEAAYKYLAEHKYDVHLYCAAD